MRINFYGYNPLFRGRREDRNTVSQLKKDNNYSLTEPNQRRINNAIENLSQYHDAENMDFILDVAENLKYGTNINTGKTVKNDWKAKLQNAAEQTLAHSNPILKEKYSAEINRVFNTPKALTDDEKAIVEYKNSILKQADLNSLKDTKNENIRSLERNLEYFTASSEIPVKQKLYVLKRLDYFMSPEYSINPQLQNRKTQVLAEMMNDLAVNTSESKVPNIKAINQKNHGMCAAISIARKAVAYEDKPNYVDAILSELDDSDKVMIYDRFNLGSGKRIPVKKTYIDFDYAIDKGYRIVDASATQWMNIADMYGINNENLEDYNPFDRLNFDAFQDAHFVKNFEDDSLMRKQCYYQALTKALEDIGAFKSDMLKNKEANDIRRNTFWNNLNTSGKENDIIRKQLKVLNPSLTKDEINKLTTTLIKLQKPVSEKIKKGNPDLIQYSFIPNEEYSQKNKKIKQYLLENIKIEDGKELDNAVKRITDSVIAVNTAADAINPTESLANNIKIARKAYESEAIYRASILLGLSETNVLTDYLLKYNIPDRETRISEDLNKLITYMETSKDSQLINHFATMFKMNPDDSDNVINGLRAVKANFDYNMTEVLDELYEQIGLGSRKDMLLDEVNAIINEVKAGSKKEQSRVAEVLNLNDDKKSVLNELEKFKNQLSDEKVSEKTYLEIFNKIGYKNQINVFVDKFQEVLQSLTDPNYPNRDENLRIFKELNNLDENASTQDMLDVFSRIGNVFNTVSEDTETAASILSSCETLDRSSLSAKGGGLSSIGLSDRDAVIKEMENRGELVPSSVMKKLQDRFVKIDKIRSADEFSSRQGKISDPELYKLSQSEKDAIKQINKKVNKMYSDVKRAMTNQYREIKPELEEMARYAGTGKGMYWVAGEGHSGLYSAQQVKIFEQLTDKPYYEEEDLATAFDKIINGTHAGISSTSVFHDKIGAHAQYVVDIKKEGPENKYALFHDNTWGASEHENTWVDSQGVTRTDYSDRRGGELGYITDENWRNGNYIENLANKKGKTTPESIQNKTYKKINPTYNSDDNFSLINGIIVNGENPNNRDIAASIKDTLYAPDKVWMRSMEQHASKMSLKEIENANLGVDYARKQYKKRYENILKRIEKTPFNEGINSKEDYDKLPDNDEIKLIFEKLAVKLANPNYYMSKEMAQAKSLDDIKKIENKLKQNAINDFNYAFGKDKDILLYYAYEHARTTSAKLLEILNKNNVKYAEDTVPNIFHNTAYMENGEESQFTGRMKDTINFIVNKTMKQFDANIPADENSLKAREEFKSYLQTFLNEIMYYNEDDIKSDKFRAKAVRNWIDRTFEPVNDEEFVKIYRKLQDMTTEEFLKHTTNLTNKDLGIKNISGYDVLTSVKACNDKADTDFRNAIFMEEYSKNVNLSKTEPVYKYQKNQKSLRAASYKNGRTFDDLYSSFFNAMNVLQYERLFNEYKDINYRKYKAMPAYPKVELVTEHALNTKIEQIEKVTTETLTSVKLRKSVLNSLNLTKKLNEYVSKIPDNRPVSKKEYDVINQLTGEFVTNNYNDPDMVEALDAAYEILNLSSGTPAGKYKPFIQTIVNEYKMIEKANANAPFKNVNEEQVQGLKGYLHGILECNIPPQFRRIIKQDFDNWINEEFKKKDKSLLNRQDSSAIRSKLDELSKPNYTKGKLGTFSDLKTQINIARLIKNSDDFDEQEFNSRCEQANKIAQTYIDKYIKTEYKNQAKRMLDNYIKHSTGKSKTSNYDPDMSNAAKHKLEEDFKKYHFTKYPVEILKSYLMAAAKDSKTADYKKNFKSLLENHLNFAALIEIQDLLMDAVQHGNAAEVRKHFKDYYVYPFNSEFPQTMDSPESISYMVKNLLINDNNETAKMFVEKLGLADTILDFETVEFEHFELDKHIKSIVNIASATQKNMRAAKAEFEKLNKTIDKSDNFEKLIDDAKTNIINLTKKNKRQAEVKNYLQALDNAKADLLEDPELKKSVIIDQAFDAATQENFQKSNNDSIEHQQFLNMIILLYSFLSELNLPEYSEAYGKQQKLTQMFVEFREKYEKSLKKLREVCTNIEVSGVQ